MKLTDTHLVLLSAASQRKDGGIELAPNLKGGAAQKLVRKLLTEGLIEEVCASGSLPVWRRGPTTAPLALRITQRGLAAIQVADGGAQRDAAVPAESAQAVDVAPDTPRRPVAAHRAGSTRPKSRDTSRGGSKQARVIE